MSDGESGAGGKEIFVDGRTIKVGHTFFRGPGTVFYPERDELRQPHGLSQYVLKGWVPEASRARPGQRIVVLGCDIGALLLRSAVEHGMADAGAPAWCAEGIAHAHGLRRVLSCAITGTQDAGIAVDTAELGRALANADVIVLCPAQSERFEAADGSVLHLGVLPPDGADASMAIASHAQTLADLEACYEMLRRLRPEAEIVLSVSPQPLPAPARPYAPFVASTASKATLRSAIDELLRTRQAPDARLHYFPAFELVLTPFSYPFARDRRSLLPHAESVLALAFACHFAVGADNEMLGAAFTEALAADVEAGEDLRLNPSQAGQGEVSTAAAPWPDEAALAADATLSRTILGGLMPPTRFVDAETTLIAFGSCFANNISRYLNNIGYNVATRRDAIAYVSTMGDGIVNTDGIRRQFEWAWEGKLPQTATWHDSKARVFERDDRVRLRTRELFDMGDLFIITLGLSEVWYDEPTGEVFWRAVPIETYDPNRHKFRMIGQAESLENLREIYRLIRTHRPDAKIVFTVSPIPLMATFRGAATIVASTVSKAILRSAVDEFYREMRPNDPDLFYFPAYEIVTHFHEPFANDLRHPYLHTILVAMKLFERNFCDTQLDDRGIAEFIAMVRNRDLALNSAERAQVIRQIQTEADAWREDDVAIIESIARGKARSDAASERAQERQQIRAEREAERAAREAERAARRAAAEAARRTSVTARQSVPK